MVSVRLATVRRMREAPDPASAAIYAEQRPIIQTAFTAGVSAAESLAEVVPNVDRDRVEFAVADVLLEEAWVVGR